MKTRPSIAPHRDNDKSYELLFRYDARAASKYYRAIDHLMNLH